MHTAVVHERTRVYKSSPIQIIHVHAVNSVLLYTQQLKNCWSAPLRKSEGKSTRCNFFMHAALVTQLAQNKSEAKQLTKTHNISLATLMMT